MLLSRFTRPLCNSCAQPRLLVSVRYFNPSQHPEDDGVYKGQKAWRCGYEAHHHTKGLLPRLKIKEKRLDTMPLTQNEDPWSARQAMMGKNDFIRILGDESIQQHELLTHIPDWLRGFKNTNKEYSVLMRKRKEFSHWKYTKPLKWLHLEQRIKFLYRHINNKYRPPDVELLSRSRHRV